MTAARDGGAGAATTAAQRARFAGALDQLAPGGMLAVAVSGGADSLGLLLLTVAVRPGRIVAATVDHGLRKDAAREAAFVAGLCRRLDVPHATLTIAVADDPRGVQAAARAGRYAALEQWARGAGATHLATAHHLDDQAETVLMRLARGSGVGGLASVRPARRLGPDLVLVRPLLAWRRAELAAIAAAAGVIPVDDPSNRDPRFDRTRVRRLLADAAWLEPGRLAATADHLRDAEEALAWATAACVERHVTTAAGVTTIDPSGLPDELLRRVLLHAFAAAGGGDAAPEGPEIMRFIARLRAGDHATLGPVKGSPGASWRLERAPPHRSG